MAHVPPLPPQVNKYLGRQTTLSRRLEGRSRLLLPPVSFCPGVKKDRAEYLHWLSLNMNLLPQYRSMRAAKASLGEEKGFPQSEKEVYKTFCCCCCFIWRQLL